MNHHAAWGIIICVIGTMFPSSLPVYSAETDVIINEIMYNPAAVNTGGEFVELYNRGAEAVEVGGWQLVDSTHVMFTLPSGTSIVAGGYLVFYGEVTAITFYGLDAASSYGPYIGGLDGGGERIALKNAGGTVMDEVIYDDNWPWPSEADGSGPSLELLYPWLDNSQGTSWGVGQPYTPGVANNTVSPGLGEVVITEMMYNPGVLNTGGEYIELYNRSGSSITLDGWQLAGGVDYTFPISTALQAGAYLVVAGDPNVPGFYGISNYVGPYTGKLDNSGELIVLKNSLGQIVEVVNYEDGAPWPVEADGFGPSLELLDVNSDNNDPANWGIGQPYTPGVANAPAVSGGGDIVISEIMYNPQKLRYIQNIDPVTAATYWQDGDDLTGEYIELYNRSAKTINLTGWQLLDEEGILYTFPSSTLAANAYKVVCSNASAISSRYSISNAVGNFSTSGDRLSNAGERITLATNQGVVVDTVHYGDNSPWPIAPDQTGVSLECLAVLLDNSTAANWRSCTVAAGTLPSSPSVGTEYFLNRGTPGKVNSRTSSGVPPFVDISKFKHSPKRPTSADSITITAVVASGETITGVTLYYEVFVAPYQTASTALSVPMFDDGLHGDDLAGDGKYGVVLAPLASQSLLRYKVTAVNGSGHSWTWPDAYEPNPNRAAFVYDGEEETNLPAYFLIAPDATLNALLNINPFTHTYYEATLVVEGIVYDHVGVHLRGRGWRGHPKKSWKVAFNKGEYLRGMSRLDLAMHFPVLQKIVHDLFWSMGHGCLASEPVRFYVNGSFYGLELAQDSPNTTWLERHGYDDTGEVFKASCAPSFGGCPSWSGTYIADLDYYADASLYPKMYEKKGDMLGSYASLVMLTDHIANTTDANLYATLAADIDLDDWLYKWTVHVAGNYGDFIGSNYTVINPAEPDLKWQLRYFDFDMFFGCMGLNFTDVICCPYTLSPYSYYAKWQERVFNNPALEDRFLTILADSLQNYMTIDNVYAMFDYWFDRTYVDRMDELALGWGGPGPYVVAETNITKGKEYFANRYGWLVNTWLPSRGYTPPANAHPVITVADPLGTVGGIQITWEYNDPENDTCTVDLYWTDRKWSHLEPIPLAVNIPAAQGSFLWTYAFPANEYLDRGIYIHAVIRDNVSDLEGHATSNGPLAIPPQNCAEVWQRGYGITEDLNADCHVDLKDFAILAGEWLEQQFTITLIAESASKQVLQPTADNPADDSWKGGQPYDDSDWNNYIFVSGKSGGVGYESSSGYENYISYNMTNANGNETRYIRIHFTVEAEDVPLFNSMILRMRYDDAFVAYLNGVEVARSNYVPSPLTWDSGATNYHDDALAVQFEDFDISSYVSALQAGDNVLALHALNYLTSSSDFLMSMELVGGNDNLLASDVDGDGAVNLDDLFLLTVQWLECNDPETAACVNMP